MGVYGCIWVFMGALGYTNTYAQTNNTKRDINGVAGYDSRPCMAGKFPQKRHICVCRHKGVRRDSGGWGWVRMGAGGCIGTQQTQNRAKRVIGGRAGHNCGQACVCGKWPQGYCGRHMTTTEHIVQYRG